MIVYQPQGSRTYLSRARQMMVGTGSWFYFGGPQDKPLEAAAQYYCTPPEGKLAGFSGPFLVNIEHLNMQLNTSIEHLKAAVFNYRVRWPGRIGIYGILPDRQWYAAFDAGKRPAWSAANLKLRAGYNSLAASVDYVCPSLYIPVGNASVRDVRVFVRQNLHQAAQYGKPIIPAVWPFVDLAEKRYMGSELWKALLTELRDSPTVPEGVLLWDEAAHQWPEEAVSIAREVLG